MLYEYVLLIVVALGFCYASRVLRHRWLDTNKKTGGSMRRSEAIFFTVGDYVAGAGVGVATAVGVRAVVHPDADMVLAMLLGMGAGMVVHLLSALVLSPILGAFHAMVPGSLIGMYGGMLFGMRDSMQGHLAADNALLVGAVFGLVVTGAVRIYDRTIRGPVSAGHAAPAVGRSS